MSLGHGQPGHRSKLATYLDLIDNSGAARHPFLELLMAKLMDPDDWTAEGSGVYSQAAAFTYDSVIRDVASVVCSVSPYVLTRVEAEASVVAGTYYFDADAAAPELFIELPDSSNPNAAVVAVHLLFTFGAKGIVHPHLGPNLLADGKLANWTTSINLTSWTEEVSGTGWDVGQDDALSALGTFSARLRGIDTTSGYQQIRQAVSGSRIVGKWYRASLGYRTSEIYTNLEGRLYIGNGASNYISQDGRNVNASDLPILQATQGEVRRDSLDFLAHDTSLDFTASLRHVAGTAEGTLWVEDLRLQRIWRFSFYDPRLGAVPELNMAMARLGFGGKTVGVGTARIINQDGVFEEAFGDLVPVSATVCGGGEFQDGQTIPREDCRVSYPGQVQDVDADDAAFELRLEAQTFLRTELPLREYRLDDFPNMELGRVGQPRPLAFGRGNFGGPAIRYCRPTRLGLDATTQYGDPYELVDTTDAPNGIHAMTVHAFLTSEMREQAQ